MAEVHLRFRPLERDTIAGQYRQRLTIGRSCLCEPRRASFAFAKTSEHGSEMSLRLRPQEGRLRAAPLRQRLAIGGGCLFELRRATLALAEVSERCG
jgi:hypothetical protein